MRGKVWMPKHTDTLLALQHLPNAIIAAHTGHCVDTVQRKRSALGLQNYYAIRYGTWANLPEISRISIERSVENAILRSTGGSHEKADSIEFDARGMRRGY
jgi:hypothetical protein